MKDLLWTVKAILTIVSLFGFLISVSAMDSETLLIPAIGALVSSAWIAYIAYSLEKGGDENVQD